MKKLYLLALVPAFALAGCYGLKKCSLDEFKEAANKAIEKAPEVESTSYNGKYGDEKIKFSTSQGAASYSATELFVAGALGALNRVDSMYAVGETFYKGFGFKVENSNAKFEYNMKGYLSSVKGKLDGKEFNFNVTQKYAK